jgi:hypothetical protein
MHIIQLPSGRFFNLAQMIDAEFYVEPDMAGALVPGDEPGVMVFSGTRLVARLTIALAVGGDYGLAGDERRFAGEDAEALRGALSNVATVPS